MRRCLVGFVLAAFLLQVSGCTRQLQVPLDDPLALASVSRDAKDGWRIAGYTTVDGVEHSFHGSVRLGEDGQFHFKPEVVGFAPTASLEPFLLPRDQVQQFQVIESTDLARTGQVVLIAAAISFVVAVIVLGTTANDIYTKSTLTSPTEPSRR